MCGSSCQGSDQISASAPHANGECHRAQSPVVSVWSQTREAMAFLWYPLERSLLAGACSHQTKPQGMLVFCGVDFQVELLRQIFVDGLLSRGSDSCLFLISYGKHMELYPDSLQGKTAQQ